MKATELMIGDWVRCTDQNPFRITDIETAWGTPYFCVTSTEWLAVDGGDLHPIPLTEEIVKDDSCPQVSIYWDDRKTEETGENWYEVMIHTEICAVELRIRYVHELQHALKLCGIEKEIIIYNTKTMKVK